MARGFTKSLTVMITKNLHGCKGRPTCYLELGCFNHYRWMVEKPVLDSRQSEGFVGSQCSNEPQVHPEFYTK
jgi:hypothetical protein